MMLNLPCQSMYVIKEEQGGEINKDDKQGQDCANEMSADAGGIAGHVSECQENTEGHMWQSNTGSRTGQDLDETGGAATESVLLNLN